MAVAALTAALLAGGPGGADRAAAQGEARWFKPRPLPAPEKLLFDLGVADHAGSGELSVFTVNHSSRAVTLERRSRWRWRDATYRLGLAQDPRFPGWERLFDPPPDLRDPGLYGYLSNPSPDEGRLRRLHLRAVGTPVHGRLILDPPRRHEIVHREGADAKLRWGSSGEALVDFAIEAGGHLAVAINYLDQPIRIETDLRRPNRLRLGARAHPAPGPVAEVSLSDRHGYAFGDVTGDGRDDLLIAVGGLGGAIARAPWLGRVEDTVLERIAGGYRRIDLGLRKGDCRGRTSAALDVDGSGRLDYFISCEEAEPLVHLQRSDGTFARARVPAGGATAHRWLKLDRGRLPSLLAARPGALRVLRRADGGWVVDQALSLRGGRRPIGSISAADIDRDGDLDVLISARDGSTLLINEGGRLRATDPARRGLPSRSAAASWVDADNDGRYDLHAVPRGLYLGRGKDRGFRRTDRLSVPRRKAKHAISTWADLDNDGRRDALYAYGPGEMAREHRIRLRQNRLRSGRWLAVDLPGAEQGSHLTVKVGKRRYHGWGGQSDDSPHSQAHNRVYFGLGRVRGPAELTVRWSDGQRTIRRVGLDRIVRPRAGGR